MNIRLGFSTGCFFRSHIGLRRRVEIIKDAGCNALEIGLIKMTDNDLAEIAKFTPEHFDKFDYVSVHAPIIEYGHNEETKKIFKLIARINQIRVLDLVIFHPNTINDFSVFDDLDFPVAFENMDRNKLIYQYPEEFEKIFGRNKEFQLVLDVNHIYTVDPSMELAFAFYKKWGHRIGQIHLSGYRGYHDPLFETKQTKIIAAIRNFNMPIIIESIIGINDIEKERDYILRTMKELQE